MVEALNSTLKVLCTATLDCRAPFSPMTHSGSAGSPCPLPGKECEAGLNHCPFICRESMSEARTEHFYFSLSDRCACFPLLWDVSSCDRTLSVSSISMSVNVSSTFWRLEIVLTQEGSRRSSFVSFHKMTVKKSPLYFLLLGSGGDITPLNLHIQMLMDSCS